MLDLLWFKLLVIFTIVRTGSGNSLLCGRLKNLDLGVSSSAGSGAALALALVRPRTPPPPAGPDAPAPCKLRVSGPTAAAFSVSLIDVKESLMQDGTGGAARKWNARGVARSQDTKHPAAGTPPQNKTEPCTLSIYIGEARNPAWRIGLCGSNAAALVSRAGARLLPPRLKIVWTPPVSSLYNTEMLRLVITAVNSGSICNTSSQFQCGATGLCVASTLVCDDVRHCPGGEDEDQALCASIPRGPPWLEVLKKVAARNQEFLGLNPVDTPTKPSQNIMKIGETEPKSNAFSEFGAALKPYGPWGYLVVGMLICATVLMFCLAWECCCKRSKPSDTPLNMPPACIDLSPTMTMTVSATQASQVMLPRPLSATPPAYESPPSYSSLFPRAFKSSPTPVPHCSHQEPPD